jgi:hypothetical protein
MGLVSSVIRCGGGDREREVDVHPHIRSHKHPVLRRVPKDVWALIAQWSCGTQQDYLSLKSTNRYFRQLLTRVKYQSLIAPHLIFEVKHWNNSMVHLFNTFAFSRHLSLRINESFSGHFVDLQQALKLVQLKSLTIAYECELGEPWGWLVELYRQANRLETLTLSLSLFMKMKLRVAPSCDLIPLCLLPNLRNLHLSGADIDYFFHRSMIQLIDHHSSFQGGDQSGKSVWGDRECPPRHHPLQVLKLDIPLRYYTLDLIYRAFQRSASWT